VPKMGIASPPHQGGQVTSRYFVPQECHPTHAVTGSINVAVAATTPGTVVAEVAQAPAQTSQVFTLEHPKGSIDVTLTYDQGQFQKAGIVRTARKIMSGHIHVPEDIFT